jgi:hypothetical protein
MPVKTTKRNPPGRPADLSPLLATLTAASRELATQTFPEPTEAQQRAKSTFWSTFRTGDIPPPTAPVDLATALRYGGDKRITEWWEVPGFRDWFSNSREFAERVAFLEVLALDALHDILRSKQTSPQAVLTAAKLVLEMADRMPRSRSGTAPDSPGTDKRVSEMSKEELTEYIRSRVTKLVPPS